jgi:hypothetical protein
MTVDKIKFVTPVQSDGKAIVFVIYDAFVIEQTLRVGSTGSHSKHFI